MNYQIEIIEEKSVEKVLPIQTNKTRCYLCCKKIGLVGIECRCGYMYCGSCRVPDKHNCSFDYLTHDRKLLEKLNIKVAGSMEKI